MLLLSRRQAHAALAGCAAAAAYFAAAEVGSKRPVRLGGLFLLSSAALAGVMAQGLSSRASVKAASVESRLNQFFNSGGHVGGNLVINGNHTINGTHTVNGQSFFGGNQLNGVQEVHSNGSGIGMHDQFYMNNFDVSMQGGTFHQNGGDIQTGGGSIYDAAGTKLQFP